MLSRGKRTLELDLKLETGRNKARALVGGADVIVENFRPGVMARLGLAPVDPHAINPSLISLSLAGFASTEETFNYE